MPKYAIIRLGDENAKMVVHNNDRIIVFIRGMRNSF